MIFGLSIGAVIFLQRRFTRNLLAITHHQIASPLYGKLVTFLDINFLLGSYSMVDSTQRR
jgi:hypothetical protein